MGIADLEEEKRVCMLTLCSFLQSVYHFVKSLIVPVTKKAYRTSAVIMSGTMVVAVMTFTSGMFGGGGKNALTAYAETPMEETVQEEEEKTEEIALLTEAKIQFHLTDSEELKEGQLLVGNTLLLDVQARQEVRKERQAAIEEKKEEIRQIEEERARIAEEEAKRLAREEQIRQEAEARKASAVIRYSDQDYEVLKRIVQAEAGICDMQGRILVANVIMNRVRDPEFPDNITDVVYQRSQFSPVLDGSINTCKVTPETVEAVNRALAGEDYSRGALYFMNRRRSQSRNVSWFDGKLTYLFQHEKHEFFK